MLPADEPAFAVESADDEAVFVNVEPPEVVPKSPQAFSPELASLTEILPPTVAPLKLFYWVWQSVFDFKADPHPGYGAEPDPAVVVVVAIAWEGA